MAGLPNFPIIGSILSNAVAQDRFSLLTNPIGNKNFPAGQYVFYTKNNSLWYKFKTPSQTWSPETLYIKGGSGSNTKFDGNGYPVTGYLLANGSVNIQYYTTAGYPKTVTVAASGCLPTVVINPNDTYLFYIPVGYISNFQYVQRFTNFNVINNYPAYVPGTISAMQIQLARNGNFIFSFESDTPDSRKVYIAFSNPNLIFATYDLKAFIDFLQGPQIDEYIVIGEYSQFTPTTDYWIRSTKDVESFTINEFANTANIPYMPTNITYLTDYIVIGCEFGGLSLISVLPLSEAINEKFYIPDNIIPIFTLTSIPNNKGPNLDGDFFIISNTETETFDFDFIPYITLHEDEYFEILDDNNNFITTLIENNIDFPEEIFSLKDPLMTFVEYYIPTPINLFSEILSISDDSFPIFNKIETVGFEILLKQELVIISDFGVPNFKLTLNPYIVFHYKLVDSFSIADSYMDYSTFFIPYSSHVLFDHFKIGVDDITKHDIGPIQTLVPSTIHETVQIPDLLSIVFSKQESFTFAIASRFNIGHFPEAHHETLITTDSEHLKGSFSVEELAITTSGITSWTIRILQDIPPYNYYRYHNVLKMLSATIFTTNSIIPVYYYYMSPQQVLTSGPRAYNIAISDTIPVIYTLTKQT